MARAFGTIESAPLDDGATSIRGRFRHDGERYRVVFGRDDDGWTEARARREMENIRVLLQADMPLEEVLKRYQPEPSADADPSTTSGDITFHEYASEWFKRRCTCCRSSSRCPWRRSPSACERFRGKLFADSEALRVLIDAGGKPTYENGQPRKPLSLRSIRSIMALLGQILQDAVEDELRPDKPARSKRLRVRVPKPNRTFLEIDQLVALLDAARELEVTPMLNERAKLTQEQAEQILARLAGGETQYALRQEYGLSSAAMSMLAQGKTYRGENGRIGWRALCAVLGYAGLRISEAVDLLERDVRLHDPQARGCGSPTAGYPLGRGQRPPAPPRPDHRAREPPARRARSPAPSAHHAPLAAANLRIDHAARHQVRHPVRAEPGWARQREDDPRRLQPAARPQQARARSGLRCAAGVRAQHPLRPCHPTADFGPPAGPPAQNIARAALLGPRRKQVICRGL